MPRTSPPALCAARACHRPQLGFLLPGAVSITLGPPPSDTTPRDQAVANRCAMRSALSQARVHFCTAGCLAALAPAHAPTLPPSCLSAAPLPPAAAQCGSGRLVDVHLFSSCFRLRPPPEEPLHSFNLLLFLRHVRRARFLLRGLHRSAFLFCGSDGLWSQPTRYALQTNYITRCVGIRAPLPLAPRPSPSVVPRLHPALPRHPADRAAALMRDSLLAVIDAGVVAGG